MDFPSRSDLISKIPDGLEILLANATLARRLLLGVAAKKNRQHQYIIRCEGWNVLGGALTHMQRLSASLSSLSSFSAPMAAFTVGPTIDPRMFANGNRPNRGIPGVTALDNLQVASVKGLLRGYLRGPATTDVATQARMAKESFMSSSRVVGVVDMQAD
jgi:hypothetical protein